MFSATMPGAIADLAAQMLRDPVKVAVDADRHHRRAHRSAHHPRRPRRQAAAPGRPPPAGNHRPRAGLHPHQARRRQSRAAAGASRHRRRGDPRQQVARPARARARGVPHGKVRTLVATDIAARGIDVDGITHVVNFDLPNVPETYVHRIGRTARAGAEGIAISLCDGEEMAFLRDIEKLIRMSLPITDRRAHPERAERRPPRLRRPVTATAMDTARRRTGTMATDPAGHRAMAGPTAPSRKTASRGTDRITVKRDTRRRTTPIARGRHRCRRLPAPRRCARTAITARRRVHRSIERFVTWPKKSCWNSKGW